MPETVDRLKILKGNAAYPRGGTCKICGFGGSDVCFRFSGVCGLHECRTRAGVCDCMACQKQKKADIEREKQTILIDLVAVNESGFSMCIGYSAYQTIAERAEKLLQFEVVSSD